MYLTRDFPPLDPRDVLRVTVLVVSDNFSVRIWLIGLDSMGVRKGLDSVAPTCFLTAVSSSFALLSVTITRWSSHLLMIWSISTNRPSSELVTISTSLSHSFHVSTESSPVSYFSLLKNSLSSWMIGLFLASFRFSILTFKWCARLHFWVHC